MGLYTHLTGGESRCIVQPFFLAAVPKVYSAVGEQIDQCGGADGLTMKDWCCENRVHTKGMANQWYDTGGGCIIDVATFSTLTLTIQCTWHFGWLRIKCEPCYI